MDNHRVTALKYAFSTAFYNLKKGQKLLSVLLRAALSWMECSGTLQLCWKVFYGADVNFEGEKELPSETVQQLFFLLWGGRYDLTSCCSAVKADFLWGGIWGIISPCALFYFVCLFVALFLISYLNQYLWELWLPPLPHTHLEESLQAVISKAGLGYFWECHSLVIHWKVKVFVWSQDGLETRRALPGQVWLSAFDYKWT